MPVQGAFSTNVVTGLVQTNRAAPFRYGHLTGDRDVVLRTDDGTMEMSGGLGWIEPPTQTPTNHLGIRLRLAISGGPFDRTTVLASIHEPY